MEKVAGTKKDGETKENVGGQNISGDYFWKTNPRHMTDVFFLILMILFFIVLCLLLGYCISNGDIFRIINGYDNCGNVCGRETETEIAKNYTKTCSSSNEKSPFLLVLKRNNTDIKDRYCVKNCSSYDGYRPFFNRCIPNATHKIVDKYISKTGITNFFQEISEDLHLCYWEIIYLFFISLLISTLLLVALRYLVGFVVWGLLIGVVVATIAVTVWLWHSYLYIRKEQGNIQQDRIPLIDSRKKDTNLVFAIISTVITVLVILVILVLRKRVKIVIQLFRESGKAVASMPVLLFLPVLTFLCLGGLITLWFFCCLWIESSGILTETNHGIFHYEKNDWMRVTRWQNIFAMLWMAQFLIGCQHMVIAGAVSFWYFTRDKTKLNTPVCQSMCNLIRYHLGSVALGSLVIAIIQFIRIILKFIENRFKGRTGCCAKSILGCCQCCLYCFEKILKYLTRNAYIEVAAYGYSFCKGGRQAFKLLVANALRVAAINSIGDTTLFLGKVITVIATVFVGMKMLENKEGLQHMWVPLTLAGLFAYFIAHCFLTVYEMIIDTIFLCFCEDCEKNDGISRPYYMSRGLMSFVENSKKKIELYEGRKYLTVNAQVSPNNESKTGGSGSKSAQK
ncbi:choline transporter-like protein 1 [Harmonia axyridis]|uniref:choline transporter-like protein 1 n=1 Tax=Harmonia axyridis TaxID=115357 RepID=UPI001E2793AA|nr:choline transporter-like protein 1 [Harmonia axyridis]XP_045462806.1 choline transporter-like protein 1 [Harmonia axyridis]